MEKIRRVSRLFRFLFQGVFFALPLLLAFFWFNGAEPLFEKTGFSIGFLPDSVHFSQVLSLNMKWIGFCISAIPMSFMLFVFYYLIRLFKLYEKGFIFRQDAVTCIHRAAVILCLSELLHPLYEVLITAAMSWQNPVGERFIAVSFASSNLFVLLLAFILLLISWVMKEACKLQEEQTYIV